MSDDKMKVQERVAAMRGALSAELEMHSVAAMNVMAETTRMATEATADGPENAAGMDKLRMDLETMAALAARAMAERAQADPAALHAPIKPGAGPSVGGQIPLPEPEVLVDVQPEELTVPSNPAVRDAVRLAVPMVNNFVRDIGQARIVLEMAFLDRTEGADAALNFIVLKAEVTFLLVRLERQAMGRLSEWTLYFQQRPDKVLKAAAMSSFEDLADSLMTIDAKAAMSVQTAAAEVVAGYATVKGKMAEVWSAIGASEKQKDNVKQLYG